MKILILNTWLITGGVERALLSYIKTFTTLNYKIEILSTYNVSYMHKHLQSELESYLNIDNIEYIFDSDQSKKISLIKEKRKISFFHKLRYEYFRYKVQKAIKTSLLQKIQQDNFDLIIDFSNVIEKQISYIRKLIKTPIIKWVHSQLDVSLTSKESKLRSIQKRYHCYDVIIAICDDMQQKLQLLFPNKKIIRIYNPIDITQIQNLSASISLNNQEDYFLLVSRLVKGKGLFELIDIYNELKSSGITHKLYIIGDGELYIPIKEKIIQKGLINDCILLGEITNPYPYFKGAKLFLFTSESEGLGMVLLESMACGTPVIAMDCPTGPKDIIGADNEYGKLIPMHNKEQFVNAVVELLSDKIQYQHYVEQSLKRASDFSSENIAKHINHIFKQIINP